MSYLYKIRTRSEKKILISIFLSLLSLPLSPFLSLPSPISQALSYFARAIKWTTKTEKEKEIIIQWLCEGEEEEEEEEEEEAREGGGRKRRKRRGGGGGGGALERAENGEEIKGLEEILNLGGGVKRKRGEEEEEEREGGGWKRKKQEEVL